MMTSAIIATFLLSTHCMSTAFQERAIEEPQLSKYAISRVISLVAQGEKSIADCTGKDLVIFIGGTQVGKSTTINSLLGVQMKKNRDGSISSAPTFDPTAPDAPTVALMGKLEEGGRSCTEFPALYTHPSSPFCFLDTRGFFDIRRDAESDTASSILMEMAVKRARNVRLVHLGRFDHFNEGLAGFSRFGEMLSDIVVSDDVPIFFLFNYYRPSPELGEEGFYEWSKEKQLEFIRQEIDEAAKRIVRAGDTTFAGVMKRLWDKAKACGAFLAELDSDDPDLEELATKGYEAAKSIGSMAKDASNMMGISEDPEFKEAAQKMRYISILKDNFARGLFGYIDPTSPISTQGLMRELSALPPIPKTLLVFSGCNTARVRFNEIFESAIFQTIPDLRSMAFSTRYPLAFLKGLIEQSDGGLVLHRGNLEKAKSPENAEALQAEYVIVGAENERNLLKRIRTLQEQDASTHQQIVQLETRSPEMIWHRPWDEKAGAYWWRNYMCKYPLSTPFVKVEEKLDKHTMRRKVIREGSPFFEVEYTSGGTARRVVGYASPLVGGLISAGILSATSHRCSGDVYVFVRPMDIESNAKMLKEMKAELSRTRTQMASDSEELSKVRAENSTSLLGKISSEIKRREEQRTQLDRIYQFVEQTTVGWTQPYASSARFTPFFRNMAEEVTSYASITGKLYDPSTRKVVIQNFSQLFAEISGGIALSASNVDDVITEYLSGGFV